MASVMQRVDRYQRRRGWAGFAFAVVVKFVEDRAGNLAALTAYYAFLSVFPLLLVLTTVLGFILSSKPELADEVMSSAVGQFPIIGDGDQNSLDPLTGSPVALVIGLILALWSGMAVAQSMQTAANTVYVVPRTQWPGFAPRITRSAELVVVAGGGLITTTLLQGLVSGTSTYGLSIGLAGKILAAMLGIGLNFVLFSYLFRRVAVPTLRIRDVAPGAAVAALAWFALQKVGTNLVNTKIQGAEGTYGTFAVVIGLLFWFFVLSIITMLCMEINVVATQRLWPRGLGSLSGLASTRADARAFSSYTLREQHARNIDVTTRFTPTEQATHPRGNGDGQPRGEEPDDELAWTGASEAHDPAAQRPDPESTQPLRLTELRK